MEGHHKYNPSISAHAFPGQQEGEQILYTIYPHWLKKALGLVKILIIALVLVYGFTYFSGHTGNVSVEWQVRIYILLSIVALVFVWWNGRSFDVARAFITDRRVVRMEAAFPFFVKRRILFWNEVTKTKAKTPTLLFRFFNVGTLEVLPFTAGHETIEIPYTFYYEDLSSYMDKVVYLYKNQSGELASLKPFVTKPKGKRFIEEASQNVGV